MSKPTIQALSAAALLRKALKRGHARPQVDEELFLDQEHIPLVL